MNKKDNNFEKITAAGAGNVDAQHPQRLADKKNQQQMLQKILKP